jgi:predicted molibdopterin-dependent oxidoreductase YjgC
MAGDSQSPRGEPAGQQARSRHSSFAGAGGGASLNFRFEGQVIAAREGQSVAAALIAAGIRSWRVDESGHHKGALCCIGYCFECRCRIDGEADRRACLTEVREGMRVERQIGLA